MGKPTVVVPLADGGTRLIYSQQPAGQQVYHMDFDAQHRLTRVEQVLDTAHFFALRNGVDTRDDVYRMFGPPAKVEGSTASKATSGPTGLWTIPLLGAPMYIDPQGVVQKVMFTDESLYIREPRR